MCRPAADDHPNFSFSSEKSPINSHYTLFNGITNKACRWRQRRNRMKCEPASSHFNAEEEFHRKNDGGILVDIWMRRWLDYIIIIIRICGVPMSFNCDNFPCWNTRMPQHWSNHYTFPPTRSIRRVQCHQTEGKQWLKQMRNFICHKIHLNTNSTSK